ncbi:hypothetical protein D1007_03057 [Hordeum vulgare]|nr:hypothetical protein D1007_03057 [Hordeum vulgare]
MEVLLHEPLKSTIEFTPLGSSKICKYDVRYEKLPLYCDCCGIVGHTLERFCNVPSEKRVGSFPKNLSIEDYWKGYGASKRGLNLGSSSRGDKVPTVGIDINNNTKATYIVRVAKAVGGLTVPDKGAGDPVLTATTATKAPDQPVFQLGQEGRGLGDSHDYLVWTHVWSGGSGDHTGRCYQPRSGGPGFSAMEESRHAHGQVDLKRLGVFPSSHTTADLFSF